VRPNVPHKPIKQSYTYSLNEGEGQERRDL
jgi:hypothetical protein